jgi:hypothetical protein
MDGKTISVSGSFVLRNDIEVPITPLNIELHTNLNNKNKQFISLKNVTCSNEKLNVIRAKNLGGNTNINFRRV